MDGERESQSAAVGVPAWAPEGWAPEGWEYGAATDVVAVFKTTVSR